MEDSQISAAGKDSDGDPAPKNVESAKVEEAALERERWLRDRFDKEHQVTLAMMRLLVGSVRNEGQTMRFWRWLIDDFRSERRLLEAPERGEWSDNALRSYIRSWFTKRRAPHGRDSAGRGLSGGGI